MNTPFEPWLADAATTSNLSPAEVTGERYADVAVPLAAATSGRLRIAPGASRITIAADPALADLCRMRFYGEAPRVETDGGEVTLRYARPGVLEWVRDLAEAEERAASILLNGSLPWRIEVAGGASRLYANLSRLQLAALQIGGGASQVELSLPHPAGVVPLRIAGGASQVTIHRPPRAAARLTIRGGASRLSFDAQPAAAAGGALHWQSPDAEQAADCYEIEVAGGVSDLLLDAQGSAAPPRRDGTAPGAINRDDLPYTGLSHELEGYLHGDVPASLIFFDGPPGSGPKLHRHPYAEIFVILEGRATFTVGEATIEAAGGQILAAPAGVPHTFINSGSGPLRQIDIHTNPRFITEWLED